MYVLIIPEFGLISHIICERERGKKETFGSLGIIYALIAIGILGIHCMGSSYIFTYLVQLLILELTFTSAAIIIAVPSGIKSFSHESERYVDQKFTIIQFLFFGINLGFICFHLLQENRLVLFHRILVFYMTHILAHYHYVLSFFFFFRPMFLLSCSTLSCLPHTVYPIQQPIEPQIQFTS